MLISINQVVFILYLSSLFHRFSILKLKIALSSILGA